MSYGNDSNRSSGHRRGYCRYRLDKRCFHSSCSFLDSLGRVSVCKFHPNPKGYFQNRKRVVNDGVSPAVLSPAKFAKWRGA